MSDLLHRPDPNRILTLPEDEVIAEWESFTEAERQAWWMWFEEEKRTPWRRTPATMSVHLAPSQWREWAYWMLLGRKFREAVLGISPRQIWELPPRYGKSTMASQWGPAWALDHDPTHKIILTSYGDDLADENARATRDILVEYSDVLRAQLRPDVKRRDRFMTGEGGGILAAGIGSAITGFGGNGAVIDDPFKNWQEAHSEAKRDSIDMAYKAVIRTRLEGDNPWQLLVMTRWHMDDIAGRLLGRMEDGTGESWELVRIPAIAERYDPKSHDPLLRVPDLLGRQPGEVIEPQKFSIGFEQQRAVSLGSFLAAALLQQRPAPDEGGEFKRSWWKVETTMPVSYQQWLSSSDMKLKERDSGDFTVIQVWGRNGKDCYLVDTFRGKWTQATTACALALVTVRYPQCRRHLVENAGYGPEVMDALRTPSPGYVVSDEMAGQLGMSEDEREAVSLIRSRGLSGLIPVTPKGSKTVRARAIVPYVEAGDVHVPAHAAWLGAFLEEMSAFPQGSYDDQCFPAGVEVETSHGPRPIEEIRAGDTVLGSKGWTLVEDAGQTGESVVLERWGRRATAAHPYFTDRGWIPFGDLTGDDTVWLWDAHTQSPALCELNRLSSTASPSADIPTPSSLLTVATTSPAANGSRRAFRRFIRRFGKRPTDRSLRDGRSTTSTRTGTTTGSRTLSASHAGPMSGCTPSSDLAPPDHPSSSLTWRRSDLSPSHGTSLLKVGNGIASMHSRSEPLYVPALPIAPRATNTPRRTPSGTRPMAGANAESAAVGDPERTTTATRPVFNLKTSDGTYFADGVLVHNCDSLSQALAKMHNLGVRKTRTYGEAMRSTRAGSVGNL